MNSMSVKIGVAIVAVATVGFVLYTKKKDAKLDEATRNMGDYDHNLLKDKTPANA